MTFHNTIKATGQTLLAFEATASSQQDRVLTVFRFAMRPLCWGEVKRLLVEDMNEVSIKRCITNLKNLGILVKTDEKVQGLYGKPNYKYKLSHV